MQEMICEFNRDQRENINSVRDLLQWNGRKSDFKRQNTQKTNHSIIQKMVNRSVEFREFDFNVCFFRSKFKEK